MFFFFDKSVREAFGSTKCELDQQLCYGKKRTEWARGHQGGFVGRDMH